MIHRASRRLVRLVFACAALACADARAFSIPVHQALPKYAFAKVPRFGDVALTLPSQTDTAAFWKWLRDTALSSMTPEERAALGAAWPDGDTCALKLLLSLDPTAKVYGLDRVGKEGTLLAQLEEASGHPDLDQRDKNRIARTPRCEEVRDRFGAPVPDDPAILNMGKLGALSSQASAHYGLLPPPHSSDTETLKTNPSRFVIATAPGAPEVLTFAPQRAQLYADLALLAALWKGPGADRLVAHFLGASWHYVQDVGSQLHTVQVGIYDFFFTAKLLYWKRAALTAGGYLGELRSFVSIGVDLITNHHVFVEELGGKRIMEAHKQGKGLFVPVLAALADDAPDLPAIPPGDAYVERLVRGVIEKSAPEGPALYRAAAATSVDKLRGLGFVMKEEHDDPDPLVAAGADLEPVYGLVKKGLARAATAMRRAYAHHEAASKTASAPAVAKAVLTKLVAERAAVAARRAKYVAEVTPAAAPTIKEPIWIAIDAGLLLFAVIVLWLLSKLFRRAGRRHRFRSTLALPP